MFAQATREQSLVPFVHINGMASTVLKFLNGEDSSQNVPVYTHGYESVVVTLEGLQLPRALFLVL